MPGFNYASCCCCCQSQVGAFGSIPGRKLKKKARKWKMAQFRVAMWVDIHYRHCAAYFVHAICNSQVKSAGKATDFRRFVAAAAVGGGKVNSKTMTFSRWWMCVLCLGPVLCILNRLKDRQKRVEREFCFAFTLLFITFLFWYFVIKTAAAAAANEKRN